MQSRRRASRGALGQPQARKKSHIMSDPQQVAVITGASSGIGRASAALMAASGFRVFGTTRKPVAPGRVVDGVELIQLDVTDDASVSAGVRYIVERAGQIDVLVNNAGIGILGGAEESSLEQARALFETNFFGVIRSTLAVLPHMKQRKSGRIINISSVFGFLPAPFMALYGSSKHALEGYTESLDHELRRGGIRAVLVEPAFTVTSFDKNMEDPDGLLKSYDPHRQNMVEVMQAAIPKADAPEVVAKVVLTAATAAKPKLRYTAGKQASQLAFLRSFLPASMVDSSLRKEFRLDR